MQSWKSRVIGKRSLIADRRGAVAFEMLFVFAFLFLVILLPLADLALAGFQYIQAFAALRGFGQYLQYNQPTDVTSTSDWLTTVRPRAAVNPSYPISDPQIICGDNQTGCSDATLSPKYYSYTTTITFAPMVLRSVLCSNSCTYTLSYSERFQ
ncbi:hypothetical protein [Bradyrhizobium sp. BRP56]|uniref:hypothetical protein n=1 Tax=Bradyrhizobium sp. BRP56 TaxID=2793819 RepID=UPI001CD58634|nr:hypothetical protein [Bradyrhizobium sp. BRP56]MCA1395725.1 hypothetical protein [Bradyrhizobium sp. BRP56]